MPISHTLKRSAEPWRLAVYAFVLGFLALSVATNTLRVYHYFLVLAIPGAMVADDRGRRFFLDWSPLFACWITYDRMRLVQPSLLGRVAVEWPYAVERALFGWMAGGQVPPHALRDWLATHADSPIVASVSTTAQIVYFSHLFAYPLLFLVWWIKGRWDAATYERFSRHIKAFTILNALGFLCYVLIPVAPPWWISAHGFAQPDSMLVASTDLTLAMDGDLIQRMIKTAPHWFAAVPSLHGGYPVLLLLLARTGGSRAWIVAVVAYGAAMWLSTVALNQHYVVDLLAGALTAVAAYWLGERLFAKPIESAQP